MGRKRDRRQTTNRSRKKGKPGWKHEETVEVLAWLDYVHGQRQPSTFVSSVTTFEDSVVGHLEKTCNMSLAFSQIDRKLRSLWDRFKRAGATDKNGIYNYGTACLDLPDDLRKDLDLRVSTLRDHSVADALSRSRQLRSTSRTDDPGNHITLNEVLTSTPRKRLRDTQSTSTTSGQVGSRKKANYSVQGLTAFTVQVPARHAGQREIESSSGRPSTPRVIPDSQEELTDDGDFDTPTGRSTRRGRAGSISSALTVIEDSKIFCQDLAPWSSEIQPSAYSRHLSSASPRTSSTQLEKQCKELQAQLDDMQEKYEDAIMFLTGQLAQSKSNCEDLQRQIDRHENAELSPSDVSSLAKANIAQNKQIVELEQLLRDRKLLRTFSSLSAADSLRPSMTDAQEAMSMIDRDIDTILHGYEDQKLPQEPNLDNQDDLKDLLRQSFCRDSSESIDFSTVGLRSCKLSFRAVVRSLIASSLCQWVFEPSLDLISAKPCALLERYRQHLSRQDGEIALRNLDFAAHKTLLNDDFVQQHVIPRQAKALADRLFCALGPFFTRQASSRSHSNRSNFYLKKKPKMIEIFDRAIRLKASMMVGKDAYEMVFYPPGTSFDKGNMEIETMEGNRAGVSAREEVEVVLCLLPSLHFYDDARMVVEPNNFVQRDHSQQQAAYKLTKAVVVI